MELARNYMGVMNRMNSLKSQTQVTGQLHNSANRQIFEGNIGGDRAYFGVRNNTAVYGRTSGTTGRPVETLTLSPSAAKHCVYERGQQRCQEFGF